MAELDTSSGGGHKKGPGVKKSKKLSTRVDLTPMVDLGFLLITFFIFTTSMSQPTAFKLNLPADVKNPDQQNKLNENSALTILLGKDNNVFYYSGQLDPTGKNFKSSNFKDIRQVIMDKKNNTDSTFMVIIKPNEQSTYKNVVNILDEMSINLVGRYALVDISQPEDQLIRITQGENPGTSAGAK
ncbi:MAG: biopolymer transporter ExbD [Bacteroidetes bacterium]|nr:biopolymer transporter ExbD [Bacteroidota bacterium]